MAFYTYSVKQTLLNLAVAENPKLAGITVDQVWFSAPVVVSGATTRVKIRGRPGSGWTGVAIVTYNRINIASLLSRVYVFCQQYNATKLSDILPRLNWLFGINLSAEDLSSDPVFSGTSATVTMNLAPSLQYYSSVSVSWAKGASVQLWEQYPNSTLSMLTLPDLMLKAFRHDYTANQSTIQAVAQNTPLTTAVTGAQALIDLIASTTGLPVTLGATATPGNGTYDLSGFSLVRTTAQTDSNPNYRQVAILTPPAVHGNQYVTLYLHYDRIVGTPTSDIITVTALDGLNLPA